MFEGILEEYLSTSALWLLLGLLALGIAILGKSADVLVDQATELSLLMGVPRVIVGATIVSLGTTVPEAVVSVMAAIRGEPDLALGNAVGSIICDTGLILGAASLITPLPLERRVVNRQGWIQVGAAVLLVLLCVPWSRVSSAWESGGVLPQWGGGLLLGLLALYLGWSVHMARGLSTDDLPDDDEQRKSPLFRAIVLLLAVAGVVLASELLIGTATEMSRRLSVPESVIAATLVAFGTSLPELVIVFTATLKGQGELAIGNVIGADILNVLFVAGAAAAVTPSGLTAGPTFFQLQFLAMLAVLLVFRFSIAGARDDRLPRWTGVLLLGVYLSYLWKAF